MFGVLWYQPVNVGVIPLQISFEWDHILYLVYLKLKPFLY